MLNRSRPATDPISGTASDSHRAIVIGGSMAGLLAARILLNHFAEVILIERDLVTELDSESSFESNPESSAKPKLRPGVPQSQHVHALLTQGYRLLEQLFPGLAAELTRAGAIKLDWTADWLMMGRSTWVPRCPSGLVGHACSRTLLEQTIRRRLRTMPNLTWLSGCQVKELLTASTPEQTRVTGVRLHWRSAEHPPVDQLEAALVVDASGRNSTLPQWLPQLGYAAPPETVVNAFLGYASRWYQRPAQFEADWQGMTIPAIEGSNSRGGVLYPVEQDRWIVTLGGVGRDYPPTDEAGFLAFARSLRDPLLSDLIKTARPLSPIYSYRRTENCWRRYEQLPVLPDGIVAIGDAVCAFNPIYGQGMTTAALGAITLDRCLNQTQLLNGFPLRFHQQLAQVLHTPWLMATGEDGRWPTTVGAQPSWPERLVQKYIDRVFLLMQDSPALFTTFVAVVHMVKPPTALFTPSLLLQVLTSYSRRLNQTTG
jgi:2-polyprenyl-6-methoxyphenol hydroxylase-like FAD-dependent oxidoreductase